MAKWLAALLLGFSLMGAGMMAGCSGSGGSLVAKVGKDKITIERFTQFVRDNNIGFRSADEEFSVKRQLLDSLINHQLLVQAAYERGLDKHPDVIKIVESNRMRFLLDALYDKHVAGQVTVSEADMREFYKDLEYQIRVSQIVVTSPDTANALVERLKKGENFEQLAYEYSIDPSAKRNRGDLGYITRGTGSAEFDRIVFRMEVNEISPPIKTEVGYHIVKVLDKKLNDLREEFPRMRRAIEQQLTAERRAEVTNRYFDSIKVKYPVTVDKSVADYVTHKRNTLYPPPVVERLPKYDFDDTQLDRDEKELVLATWDGGQMSLIEYLFTVRRAFQPGDRPAFDNYDSLAAIIYTLKRPEILAHEAELEGMAETEVYRNKTKLFTEYSMADIMRNDSLPQQPAPTEEELREYYDLHRDQFLVPRRVHLYEISVSDEMLAQNLAKQIKSLQDFQVRAAQYTERTGMRVKGGDMGYVEQALMPDLYRVAQTTEIGTLAGPFRNAYNKYSLIWPVEWTVSEYKDYLAAKPEIQKLLGDQKKQQGFLAWIEQRRATTDIDVYEDAIWETIDRTVYGAAPAEGKS